MTIEKFFKEIKNALLGICSIVFLFSCNDNEISLSMENHSGNSKEREKRVLTFGEVDPDIKQSFHNNLQVNVGRGLENCNLDRHEHFLILIEKSKIYYPIHMSQQNYSTKPSKFTESLLKFANANIGVYPMVLNLNLFDFFSTKNVDRNDLQKVFEEKSSFFELYERPMQYTLFYIHRSTDPVEGAKRVFYFSNEIKLAPVFISAPIFAMQALYLSEAYNEFFGKESKVFCMHPIFGKTVLEGALEKIATDTLNKKLGLEGELSQIIMFAYKLQIFTEKNAYSVEDAEHVSIPILKRGLLQESILSENLLQGFYKKEFMHLNKDNCFIITSASPQYLHALPYFLKLRNIQPPLAGSFKAVQIFNSQSRYVGLVLDFLSKGSYLNSTNGLTSIERQNPFGDEVSHFHMDDHYMGRDFDDPQYSEIYFSRIIEQFFLWINGIIELGISENIFRHKTFSRALGIEQLFTSITKLKCLNEIWFPVVNYQNKQVPKEKGSNVMSYIIVTCKCCISSSTVNLHPRSLKNIGDTCYMNSGLQMLFEYKPFKEHLTIITENELANKLKDLYKIMGMGEITQKLEEDKFRLLNEVYSTSGMGYGQQDVHEFVMTIFDKTKFNPIIPIKTKVKCQWCASSNTVKSKEHTIILDVGSQENLQKAFEAVQQPELLETYACNDCESCLAQKIENFEEPKPGSELDQFIFTFKLFNNLRNKIPLNEGFLPLSNFKLHDREYKPKISICHIGGSLAGGHYIVHDHIGKIIIDDERIYNDDDSSKFSSPYMVLYEQI